MKKLLFLLFLIPNLAFAQSYGTVQRGGGSGLATLGAAVGTPGPYSTSSSTTGLFSSTATSVGVSISGVERMTINSSGISVNGSISSTSGSDSSVTFSNNMAIDGTATKSTKMLNASGSTIMSFTATGASVPLSFLLPSIATGGVLTNTATGVGNLTCGTGISCSGGILQATGTAAASISIGSAVSAGTAGSALYVDGSAFLAQDNANFYWDETNHRLGLGTTSPSAQLHVAGTSRSDTAHPATNQTVTGQTQSVTVNANATGLWSALYLTGTGYYNEAKANSTSTMPVSALALQTGTGTKQVLLSGYARDDSWTWTPGGYIYASSATAGAMTQTRPSTTGNQVQILGIARSATVIEFRPNLVTIEVP